MLYNNNLLKPLLSLAAQHPNFSLLEDGGKKVTALALVNKSKTVAQNLLQQKFSKGDIALLAIVPGENFLIIFYALLMLRAKIAIIDPEMGRENYAAKMQQLKPKWLFAESKLLLVSEQLFLRKCILLFKKNLPRLYFVKGLNIVSVGAALPIFRKHKNFKQLLKPIQEVELQWNTTPYESLIIYTSGTLSVPKGVVHSDSTLHQTLVALGKVLASAQNEIIGTYLPHFMLLGIASGYTVKTINHLLPAALKLQEFKKKKISIYFGTPNEYLSMIEYCEKEKQLFPDSLRHLIVGSAPVHKTFLERLVKVILPQTKITCTYGMTEHLMTAIADGRQKIQYTGNGDLLGVITEGVQIKIEADGEIMVQSPQLFTRYIHQENGAVWHASGDLGKLDKDGNLVLLGRKKDMIIRKDFNIYPALYEDTIKRIKNITEVALVGIYDEAIQDEKVYLVVETTLSNVSHLHKLLKTGPYSIDNAALPDVILKMELPRNGRHQKIDKIALVEKLKKIYH
jgi:acyl-CoA synthetase (AMP-forming)/AMP-acid ligase II